MTKKHFISLADYIRNFQGRWGGSGEEFNEMQLNTLADFCSSTNPRFNRERWLGYIHGECGSNGGKVK